MHCIIKDDKCQVELKKVFEPKKKSNLLLAESYRRIFADEGKRANNVERCGTFLEVGKTSKEEFKLKDANFCRDRLCPTCSWRRSLKIFSQVSSIMDIIEKDYKFIFLTLTVPNCSGSELKQKIDDMQNNFREKFCKNKKFKKAVKGFFRNLEITHDNDRKITTKKYNKSKAYYRRKDLKIGDINPNFDKYHPHFHVILAVDKDYLKRNPDYITRDEWLEMWQKAMNDYSITQVDIRVCKAKEKLSKTEQTEFKRLHNAICEVAKYSVKSTDYIVKKDEELTDSTVKTLFNALHRRRLCGLGGCFKKAWEQVRGQDKELGEGDLININGTLREDIFIQLYRYEWSNGCYKLVQVEHCDTGEVTEIITDKNKRYAVDSTTGEVEEIDEIIKLCPSSERPAKKKTIKNHYCDELKGCNIID